MLSWGMMTSWPGNDIELYVVVIGLNKRPTYLDFQLVDLVTYKNEAVLLHLARTASCFNLKMRLSAKVPQSYCLLYAYFVFLLLSFGASSSNNLFLYISKR